MLSDIEIARQATPKPITEIAASLGIPADELEPYGKTKAKISESNHHVKTLLICSKNMSVFSWFCKVYPHSDE